MVASRQGWNGKELCWGLWNSPESELMLVEDVKPDADVIELGSGTAAISAWLTRRGIRSVAVDFSRMQLDIAERLQREFGPHFPLVYADAEHVPYDNESFDLAISEYGASLWCEPRRWLPEANRLLRPGGQLIFITNGAMLIACTPSDGGRARDVLVRSYFGTYRVEVPDDQVEFHPTHGEWVQLLHENGFSLVSLIEVRPPHGAKPRLDFASVEWARQWPSEEIWIARKVS
jgi:SAM-dependent methyltransferase